ncbi:Lyso-phosphatidylcholine acyltransferase [Purpureocillium takamizusanense]|uniref:Tafazzin family protein n=2 Tax=Purpureocillium takamizusanense TaxID=2060973 RepID=A0A9Q8VCA6_9HYPO|nr:Lyso-phosphatidylcholine acyltransferase [Purpureocillium takamizusanense]UNI19684.1 Lyso-phosphatidylcholine acyltransferase [Purpureocillium takamizusanense]
MSGTAAPPVRQSLPWRLGSVAVMSSVGFVSRAFLYGLNKVEVTGLDNLLSTLDRRRTQCRDRGLLTVCNHVAVVDDPLMWGILPLRYQTDVRNLRWSLGAHDICFKNSFFSTFFSLGQVLPTRRLWHSPLGGLYQPTMTQAVQLLSGPSTSPTPPSLTFSTDGTDSFPAPAAYTANRNAWVHVFPEACCHQSPDSGLRYFKWGVSRLILESDPAPEFIPMFIHGTQSIMPEDRGFPRFLPRIGKRFRVVIGEPTDVDRLFGEKRAAWKKLVETSSAEDLQHGPEAVQLRIEVARSVRDEIQKLRESAGFPHEEDETAALADTWSKEPSKRKFKSPVDGSLVNRH